MQAAEQAMGTGGSIPASFLSLMPRLWMSSLPTALTLTPQPPVPSWRGSRARRCMTTPPDLSPSSPGFSAQQVPCPQEKVLGTCVLAHLHGTPHARGSQHAVGPRTCKRQSPYLGLSSRNRDRTREVCPEPEESEAGHGGQSRAHTPSGPGRRAGTGGEALLGQLLQGPECAEAWVGLRAGGALGGGPAGECRLSFATCKLLRDSAGLWGLSGKG